MTEPRQDLPTDPQLSRLYRERAVDEPADVIDQRILAAARQAVSSIRLHEAPRNGWWQRWRMPLSLATTVMLTVMLALLVERQPTEISIAPSREKEAVESTQKRAEPVPIPPAPAKAVQVPASPSVQKIQPKAELGQSERDSSGASNRAADQAVAAPSPNTKAESASPASSPSEAAMRAAPALSAGPPAATPLAKSRADNSRSPAVWLEEIRTLRRAGKTEEAERQLREFRLAYPDYLLPEEFRQ